MRRYAAIFVALMMPGAGCFPDVSIDDTDLLLSCDPDADNEAVCPAGFTCKAIGGEGQCIANAVLSRDPIELVTDVAVNATRLSIQAEHNALQVTFALSEDPVSLEIKAGGRNLVCDSAGDGPVTFTCDTTIDLTFDDGPNVVVMNARDPAGNTVSSEARFVVDKDPPQLSVVSAVTNQNPVVLTQGASLTLNLVFDEAPVSVSASLSPGGEPCVVGELGNAVVSCAITVTDPSEGPRQLSITVEDDVANSHEIASDPVLSVDVTPPAAPRVDVEGEAIYIRSPWGSGDSDRASFVLQAQPTAIEAGATIAVFADVEGAIALAQADPAAGDVDLGAVDRARVFVAAVDAAGNRSDVVAVKEQRWIASLGNKVGTRRFENPHQVFAVSRVSGRLIGGDEEVEDASALDPGNTNDVSVAVTPGWAIDEESTLPSDRQDMCLAFDSARGQVLLFGGTSGGTATNDTWLFTDGRWRRQTPTTSPAPRSDTACAYDPVRDRVILAGGLSSGNTRLDEIWEWDGVTWARAGARLPLGISAASAAFDLDSLSVIVVGGDDGDAVVDSVSSISASGVVAVDGARPPARRHGALATRDDGAVVLFGGEGQAADLDDTWLFEGGVFRELSVTAPQNVAADLEQPVLATVGGDVFFFAGILNQTFRLGASAWIEESAERRPGARIGLRATSTPNEAILFGGAFDDATSTQRFSALRFSVVNANRLPTARGTQVAYDVVDNVVVAVSPVRAPTDTLVGSGSFVYVDDGASVRRSAEGLQATGSVLVSSSESGQGALGRPLLVGPTGDVLAFDGADFVPSGVAATVTLGANTQVTRVGDRVLLLNSDGTFQLDAGVWTRLDTVAPSVVASQFSMGAISGTTVVAFNGTRLATFDGSAWTEVDHSGPEQRQDAAVAHDTAQGRLYLMGGIGGAPLDDVWYVDETGFTQVEGLGPSARFGQRMTYDVARRQLVLVGGNPGAVDDLDEVWRFQTASADRPAIRVAISVGASQVPIDELIDISVNVDVGSVDAPQVWRLGRFEPLDGVVVDRGVLVGDEATLHVLFPASATGEDATADIDDFSATVSFRSN